MLGFDASAGIVEVEAGSSGPRSWTTSDRPRGAIRQKQTGADRLSLGGALSANGHGRGLTMKPIVSDVESLTLIGPDGELRTCSRDENADLFALVAGGYGLFGVDLLAPAAADATAEARARRRGARARRADGGLRRADRGRLPVRGLPVRDRPGGDELPQAGRLLLLPPGRGRRPDSGGPAGAHDRRLEGAALPRRIRTRQRRSNATPRTTWRRRASSTGPTRTSPPSTSTTTTERSTRRSAAGGRPR